MLMDIDKEMIDFIRKYSVFDWHSLESYRLFQNLAEYAKYVVFLYCIYQCNVLSALIPVGSHKTYLPSCSHSSDRLPLPCPTTSMSSFVDPGHLSIQPDYIQTYTLEPLRWIQQVFQAPIGLCCMMRVMSASAEKKCSVWSSRNKNRLLLKWTNTDSLSWSQVWKVQS